MHVFNLSGGEDYRVIEIDFDFITVTKYSINGNSIIESTTVKIEEDVDISIIKKSEDLFDVDFNWYWREKYRLEDVTTEIASYIQKAMDQIITVRKAISNSDPKLEGIKVGNQIWGKTNLSLDVGNFSVEPLFQMGLSKECGLLYSWEGAVKAADSYPGWRIPTVEDYQQLFRYLEDNLWVELMTSMNFKLCGVYSERLLELHGNPFSKSGDPLSFEVGGFYWTSDSEPPKKDRSRHRRLIRFNSLNKKIEPCSISERKRNMLSLRLIKEGFSTTW